MCSPLEDWNLPSYIWSRGVERPNLLPNNPHSDLVGKSAVCAEAEKASSLLQSTWESPQRVRGGLSSTMYRVPVGLWRSLSTSEPQIPPQDDTSTLISQGPFVSCKRWGWGNSPGGTVTNTLHSQCSGPGFDPWQRTISYTLQLRVCMTQLKIQMPQLKIEDATCLN